MICLVLDTLRVFPIILVIPKIQLMYLGLDVSTNLAHGAIAVGIPEKLIAPQKI